MPAPASAGTVSSRCSTDWAAVLNSREFVDDRLPLRGVAPDADALVGGWLPGVFVDDDRIPADLPFETRRRHGVVGQFLVVGVLADRQRHVESRVP